MNQNILSIFCNGEVPIYDQVEGFKCDRASSNYSPTKTSRPTDTHSLIEVNQWALESLTSIVRDKIEKSTST